MLAVAMYLVGGMPWLVWGFCLPTVTLAHSDVRDQHGEPPVRVAPLRHDRRIAQQLVTALFAVGEGWHNNHHRYQRAARNGFYWWEFDPTWYVIRLMQMVGLAWDVQPVPARIYAEARATKERRKTQKAVSVVEDNGPIGLELAEDLD